MSDPRFVVDGVSGWPMGNSLARHSNIKVTSYYVFDKLYGCAVVYEARTNDRKGEQDKAAAKRRAQREAARLNAWWHAELQRG